MKENDLLFDTPLPFDEAFAIARRKGILRNQLSSLQLSRLKQQVKQRAVFSARMDKAGVLQSLLDAITKISQGSGIDAEGGRLRSIPEAKAQLRRAMFEAGVPLAPVGTAKVKDFYSDYRRGLMVETTVLDTMGFGQHVAGQNPAILFSVPALELVRMRVPKGGVGAERDWDKRWDEAYDSLGEDDQAGCTTSSDGRLVALKNNPIWQALGDGEGGYTDTLGNPWAPFAFNSGMGQVDVLRADAIALGIMEADDRIEPDDSFDMNESLEVSAEKFDAAIQDQLVAGGFALVDGVLRLSGNAARRRSEPAFLALNERLASNRLSIAQQRAGIKTLLAHLREAQ